MKWQNLSLTLRIARYVRTMCVDHNTLFLLKLEILITLTFNHLLLHVKVLVALAMLQQH